MADKNHRESTSAILEIFKNHLNVDENSPNAEEISDDKRPVDSLIRKKKDTEKFFAILRVLVFIDDLRIRLSRKSYIEKICDNARHLAEIIRDEYLSKIITTQGTLLQVKKPASNTNRLDELKKLYFIFNDYLNRIQIRLNELEDKKKYLTKEIAFMQNKRAECRKKLIALWNDHLKNYPIVDVVQIYIDLPEKYKNISQAKLYKGFIEIDLEKQKRLLENARMPLASENYTINDSANVAHEEIMQHLKQNLNEEWKSIIPDEEREHVIDEILKGNEVQANVAHLLPANLCQNTELKVEIDNLNELDDCCLRDISQLEVIQSSIDSLSSIANKLKEQWDSVKNLIDSIDELGSNLELNVDNHIEEFKTNCDLLNTAMQKCEESYIKSFDDLENISLKADSLLDDFDSLMNDDTNSTKKLAESTSIDEQVTVEEKFKELHNSANNFVAEIELENSTFHNSKEPEDNHPRFKI